MLPPVYVDGAKNEQRHTRQCHKRVIQTSAVMSHSYFFIEMHSSQPTAIFILTKALKA